MLSVPPLLWFGHHPWAIIHTDASRYLFAASELVSGGGLESPDGVSNYNGGHGPGFPASLGALILIFGRNTQELAWAVRLMALLNPLLAYFLAKRLSSLLAGLITAVLVTLFGFNVKLTDAFDIDAALLTFYLLALLTLLAAIKKRGSAPLALLSGMLLGASILTKETAFANLPLALLAVLLLDWEVRAALWHYLGVALVCVPWWIWVYSASGKIYLIDRLPPSMQLPVLAATIVLLVFGVLAYAFGMVDRFLLAEERWRRWVGRFLVAAWSVSLSVLVLTTGSHKLAKASLGSLRHYLAHLLAPTTIMVPMLMVVGGYVIYKALWHNGGAWKLLALALLFQMPVCMLVAVEGWVSRQFLVTQTLLLCALGALVADALGVALGKAVSPESGYPARLVGAVVAASLAGLLLVSSVERAQALLPKNPAGLSKQHWVAPQATGMIAWMDQNVPEGERILVNPAQGQYLAYVDGGRHEWTFLRLDQGICVPRPNAQIRCNPEENAISRIPPEAIWVQMIGRCKVVSLSMPNLLNQLHQSSSEYVMITGSYVFPGILGLPSLLQQSGAFEVVHAQGRSDAQGVVLLKSTGEAPRRGVPTLMNRNAVANLERCEHAKGRGYSNWLEFDRTRTQVVPTLTLVAVQ
jgi:4-amino-4-deoxy-L-arabinose transferase-like glycosyltransferase